MIAAGPHRAGQVLAERVAADGTLWQARRSSDRGRLIVVAVIPPSTTETLVAPLTNSELQELLEGQVSAS